MLLNHLKNLKRLGSVKRLTFMPSYSIHYQPNQFDVGNIVNSINVTTTPQLSIVEKLSYLKPMRIYEFLDEFSRQMLFYLSDDLNLGLGTSVIIISVALKLLYSKTIVKGQAMAYDRQQTQGEFRKLQSQVAQARNQKDPQSLLFFSKKMYQMRRESGMFFTTTLLNLSQIPLLLTWFVSLRYVCSMPELFPGIKTQGLLWFTNLSTYDPYFVIPILSATFSFINISYSPKLAINIPILRPIMQYMRFVPFYGLPFLIFFPSAINLYWMISSFLQLCLVLASRNTAFVQAIGIKTRNSSYKPVQKIFKASVLTSPISINNPEHILNSIAEENEKSNNKYSSHKHQQKAFESKQGEQTIKVVLNKPKKVKNNNQQPKK